MKINRILAVCGLVLLTVGCYRGEIDALKNQIDSFKTTEIAPLEEQLKRVSASVDQLIEAKGKLDETVQGLVKAKGELQTRLDEADKKIEALSTSQAADKKEILDQLNTLKADLEEKLKIVNASIDTLEQKGKELDQRIDDLNKYLADQMSDVWTEFKKTADVIAGIDVTLNTLKESIKSIDSSLSARIEEVRSDLEGDLKKAVDDVTDAYSNAIKSAKTEILLQVDKEIENTILQSKEMILGWVNEDLLINYYKKAEVDAMIGLLEAADASINKDIEDLRKSLADAMAAMEAAIKKAIEDARIDERIADAIAKVMPDIEQLKKDVEQCLASISNLKTRVASLEHQAAKMEQSIQALEAMDAVLSQYIEELQKIAGKLRSDMDQAQSEINGLEDAVAANTNAINAILYQLDLIDARIEELQKADDAINERITELAGTVSALRTDMQKAIDDTYTWAQDTFVTQTEFGKTAELVKTIQTNVEKMSSDLESLGKQLNGKIDEVDASVRKALSKAVEDSQKAYEKLVAEEITKLDTSLKNWVNQTLEDTYWKKADIKAELDALQKAFQDKDALHEEQIKKLQADLAKLDETVESTCKSCIQEAVLDGGYIGSVIISKIAGLKSEIEPKLAELNTALESLEGRFNTLDAKIAPIEGQISTINQTILDLKAMDGVLQGYINSILKVVGDTTKYDKTVLQYIADLQQEDSNLQKLVADLEKSVRDNTTSGTVGYTIQGWIDASLQTFYDGKKVEARLEQINKDIAAISKKVDSDKAEIIAAIDGVKKDVSDWLTDYEQFKKDTEENFTKYLNDAKSYTDKAIKEKLAGYYTKFQVDSILKAQNDTIANHYKKAIEVLDGNLTDKYKKAIQDAVDAQGVVNEQIQKQIDDIRGGYEGSMNDLNKEILALKDRVQRLEDIVQSIAIVPEYNDGVKMGFEYDEKTATPLRSTAKGSIQVKLTTNNAAFDFKNYVTTVKVLIVRTRAAGDEYKLKVTDSSYVASSGILTVGVDGTKLPDEFFAGSEKATVVVTMSDKVTEQTKTVITNISSSYVNIYPVATKELEYALDPFILTFPSEGGEQNVNVRRPEGVSFTVESKPAWITVVSQDPVLKVKAAPDDSGQGREGTVNVKFNGTDIVRALTVKQAKRGVQVLTIAPNTLNWAWNESGNSDSGRKSVIVYPSDGSQYGNGWTIEYTEGVSDWLANNAPTYNDQDKTTTVVFYAKNNNNSGKLLSGSVIFKTIAKAGDEEQIYELEVSQALRTQNIESINPGELVFDYGTNLTDPQYATVSTTDGASDWTWSKTEGSDWLVVAKEGNRLSVCPQSKNFDSKPRYAEVVVKPAVTGGASQTLKVVQKCVEQTFKTIDPTEVTFEWTEANLSSSDRKSVTVTPDPIGLDGFLSYTVFDWELDTSTIPAWLDCKQTESRVPGHLIYNYYDGLSLTPTSQNVNGEKRECDIRIKPFASDESAWRTIHVVQKANVQNFTISGETSMFWNNTAGTTLHVVPTDEVGNWKCSITGPFTIKNHQASGYKGTQDLVIMPNTVNYSFTQTREGTISFTSATGNKTSRTITQEVRPVPTLTFSEFDPFTWQGDTEGKKLTVTSSDGVDDWKLASYDADWLEAEKTDGGITLKVTPRDGSAYNPWIETSGNGRKCTLHFVNTNSANSGEEVGTLEITQLNRGSQELKITPKVLKNFLANGRIEGDITRDRQLVNITADGYDWKAEPAADCDWIRVQKAPAAVTVWVETNPGGERTGSVKFIDYTGNVQHSIEVKQLENVVQTIELGSTSGSFLWNGLISGDSSTKMVVSVKSNDTWSAKLENDSASWIHLDPKLDFTELAITVDKMTKDNWSARREGKIQFIGADLHTVLADFTVTQFNREKQGLTVSPDAVTVDWKGGVEKSASVTPDDNEGDWTYPASVDSWLKSFSVSKGEKGVGTVKFTPERMTSANWNSDRSCVLTFTPAFGAPEDVKTLTVTQTQRPDQTFTPSPANGSTILQKVTTERYYSSGYKYRYSFADIIITPNPSDGESDWSVECKTAGFTATKDGNNVKISMAQSEGNKSDWSGIKDITLVLDIKPLKGVTTSLTYTVKQMKLDDPKSWFSIDTPDVKSPVLSGYSMTLGTISTTKMNTFNVKVDGSDFKPGDKFNLDKEHTFSVTGKGDNSGLSGASRHGDFSVTVNYPDGTTYTITFQCNFGKNNTKCSSIE